MRVLVIRVAAVDQNVAGIQQRLKLGNGVVHRLALRHHDPDRLAALSAFSPDLRETKRPRCPMPSASATASALKSKPTTWWPPSRSRSAMLPPILPRPISPSCISPPSPFAIFVTQNSQMSRKLAPQTAPRPSNRIAFIPTACCARHILLPIVDKQNPLRRPCPEYPAPADRSPAPACAVPGSRN